jgi:hypothetical protein
MDPLMVFGCVCKGIDPLLGDLDPITLAEVPPYKIDHF